MGLRLRLQAPTSTMAASRPQVQVILTALKSYGMIVADNGSDWYLSGAPDSRWDDDVLHSLSAVKGSDFEVVDWHAPGARRLLRVAGSTARVREGAAWQMPGSVYDAGGSGVHGHCGLRRRAGRAGPGGGRGRRLHPEPPLAR